MGFFVRGSNTSLDLTAPLPELVEQNWIEQQSQVTYPVDVMGRPIPETDLATLWMWKRCGIHQHMKPPTDQAARPEEDSAKPSASDTNS